MAADLRCSDCGSDNLRLAPYDAGVCPQTDYQDAGVTVTCLDCGAENDVRDCEMEDDEDERRRSAREIAAFEWACEHGVYHGRPPRGY